MEEIRVPLIKGPGADRGLLAAAAQQSLTITVTRILLDPQ
jgi:hypothetical protein